jgi:hypothetical protein
MKIAMHKHSMTRWCQDYEKELLESAGWVECTDPADHTEKPEEEIIRPKAPVKSKATVTAVEAANINIQGDE